MDTCPTCGQTIPSQPSPVPDLARASRLFRALSIWSVGITEAKSPAVVLVMITEGLGWPHAEDISAFEWCGAFAAWVDKQAIEADAKHRRSYYASTYRLHSQRPAELGAQWKTLPPPAVQVGDIVIVGREPTASNGARRWGQHITIVAALEPDRMLCVGGNQSGFLPDGKWSSQAVAVTWYPRTATASTMGLRHVVPMPPFDTVATVGDLAALIAKAREVAQ